MDHDGGNIGDDDLNHHGRVASSPPPSAGVVAISSTVVKPTVKVAATKVPDDGTINGNGNDVEEGESIIKFDPSDVDIVSTKIRTWNARHPGNIHYTELVARVVASGSKDLTATSIRDAANEIYEILTVQRGGRFLKLPERVATAEYCTLLTPKRCVEKIIHAIKTATNRSELRQKGVTQPYKKEKKNTDVVGSNKIKTTIVLTNTANNKTKNLNGKWIKSTKGTGTKLLATNHPIPSSIKKKSHNRVSSSSSQQNPIINSNRLALLPFSVAYDAVAGNQPIHWYGLKVVSVVCSQSDPWTAFQALDVPCGEYTTKTEPDRERSMRLQLRQRFASAAISGMSCMEFGRKLLQEWGGRLVEAQPMKVSDDSPLQSSSSIPVVQCDNERPDILVDVEGPATTMCTTNMTVGDDGEHAQTKMQFCPIPMSSFWSHNDPPAIFLPTQESGPVVPELCNDVIQFHEGTPTVAHNNDIHKPALGEDEKPVVSLDGGWI